MMLKKIAFYTFLLLVIGCNTPNVQLTKITGKRLAIDSTLGSDKTIEEIITPFRQELEQNMNKVLCEAPKDFVKNDGVMQSSLGNLIADLTFEMANPIFKQKTNTNIDFVFLNSGGLRAPIPKGRVTTKNAFLVMPFENELVVTKLAGNKVAELFAYFVKNKSAHPISKQVQVSITNNEHTIKIKDKLFNTKQSYYVLTNDYLQGGGDGMTFFANPEELIHLEYKARDAILDYFTKVSVLEAAIDNRVIVKK